MKASFITTGVACLALLIACAEWVEDPEQDPPPRLRGWIRTEAVSTSRLIDIAFMDADTGVAVGRGTIVRTTNGGRTWQPVDNVSQQWLGCLKTDGAGSWCAVGGSAGSTTPLFISNDGGRTWERREWDPGSAEECFSMMCGNEIADFEYAGPGELFALGDSWLVLRSVDGAVSWKDMSPAMDPHGWSINLNVSPDGKVLAIAGIAYHPRPNNSEPAAALVVSTDGGSNWKTHIYHSSDFSPMVDGFFLASPIDADNILVIPMYSGPFGTYRDILLRTNDGGETWRPLEDSPEVSFDIQMIDRTHGFALARSLYLTSDGGDTWTLQDTNGAGISTAFFLDRKRGWALESGSAVVSDGIATGVFYTTSGGD